MPSKAQRHKDEVIEFLKDLKGSEVNQWGNIVRSEDRLDHGEIEVVQIKYKVKKSALRKEIKREGSKTWFKVWSAYFKDLKLEVTDEKTKLIILKTM